jgi:hypothetical protein
MARPFEDKEEIPYLEKDFPEIGENANVEYFEKKHGKIMCYFAKYNEKIYRHGSKRKIWLRTCNNECYNFYDNCITHKNIIDNLSDDITKYCQISRLYIKENIHPLKLDFPELIDIDSTEYFDKLVRNTKTFFAIHNNKTYKFSKSNKKWKIVCQYENCSNYADNNNYCASHLEGKCVEKKINDSEIWFENFLTNSNAFESVKNISRENSKTDLIVKFNNSEEYRSIQIKTLGKHDKEWTFVVNTNEKYDPNMLIACITYEKDKFALFYQKDYPKSAYMNYKFCENFRGYLFTSLEEKIDGMNFIERIIDMVKSSTIYNDFTYYTSRIERESLTRFEEKCKINDLKFTINVLNNSVYDAIVSYNDLEYKIQHKSTKKIIGSMYEYSTEHYVNNLPTPYSENDDIDYFVFENIDENNFFIVPINVMAYFGYVSNKKYKGKKGIKIPSNQYTEDHWLLKFKNCFNIFKEKNKFDLTILIDNTDPFYNLRLICDKYNFNFNRDYYNNTSRICTINNKQVKFLTSSKNKCNSYVFTISFSYEVPYNKNIHDIPYCFIFQIKDTDYFYVIPSNIFIDNGVIGDNNTKGKVDFIIPEKNNTGTRKAWLFNYINKFDIFMNNI